MKKKLNSYFIKARIELNTVRIKSCLFWPRRIEESKKKNLMVFYKNLFHFLIKPTWIFLKGNWNGKSIIKYVVACSVVDKVKLHL